MKRIAHLSALLLLILVFSASAQISTEQLGVHDMTPMGASNIKGRVSSSCLYCHAPHGGSSAAGPLWNQSLSSQTYSTYTSTTSQDLQEQPAMGSPSKLCLSCHDGSVAPGTTIASGQLTMSGSMSATGKLGANLASSHPFSLQTPLNDVPDLNASLFASPARTADPTVKLVNGTVECTSCHEPHFQNIDPVVQQFLVRDGANSKLCLACHDPNRVVTGKNNYLSGWAGSIHATSTTTTSNAPYVGGYATVAQNGCVACHMPHSAAGAARLLRGADQQDCATCHNGSNTQPLAPNVMTQFAKRGHPFTDVANKHDRAEANLLNGNRHSTCVDCHNPHASQKPTVYGPAPAIRVSQAGVTGLSATDGTTTVAPAINQYENCFRCHGESTGKKTNPTQYGYLPLPMVAPTDPLNVRLQFSPTYSSHPVTHPRNSTLPQPSLRTNMMNLDGTTPGRLMGQTILCTDCHNSDDNVESGGKGAGGPHGSVNWHILERRYEFSQTTAPGALITNIYKTPDLGPTGPYGMCAKCHDLNTLMSSSPVAHSRHVMTDGVSCSTCHVAHGMGGSNSNLSGDRMVNFDLNVVAPRNNQFNYSRTKRTCNLVCHGWSHNNSKY